MEEKDEGGRKGIMSMIGGRGAGRRGPQDRKGPVSNAADKPTVPRQTPLDLAARTENQLHPASTMAGISEMGNF